MHCVIVRGVTASYEYQCHKLETELVDLRTVNMFVVRTHYEACLLSHKDATEGHCDVIVQTETSACIHCCVNRPETKRILC